MRNYDRHEDALDLIPPLKPHDDKHGFHSSRLSYLPGRVRARISGRHNLQAVLSNSSWLFSDKLLRMGAGLIVGLWVARYLGPEQFGLWNFAIAFTSIFATLASLGLDGLVVRELVTFPEKRDVILGSAFALRLIAGLITFVIVLAVISIMRRGETLIIWVVALSAAAFMFQPLNVIDLFFQSRVQSKYTVYATNGAFLSIALLKAGLLLMAAPLIAFVWAALGESALSSLFLVIAYRARHMSVLAWRSRLPVMRDLLRDGWPLILSGISIMISVRVDQVLIGLLLNDKQVGIYSAAARISEIWYFIPFGIMGSVFPVLVESKKLDEVLYYQRLQKYCNVLALISISFALFTTVLAGPITRLLYGPAYAGCAGVVRVLIWAGVPMAVGGPWTNWMLLENKTKTMFYFQVFGAVINVILNLLLIPHFGIVGSAYATLISYGAWIVLLCPLMKSQHKVLAILVRSMLLPLWLFKRPEV